MTFPLLGDLAFFLFAGLTLGFGALVAFSRNIVYSAFALLGCFSGVAGLYVLLAADFVGILQLFVYVGGITVLLIFAVMFTQKIGDIKLTNQSMNWGAGVVTAGVMFFLLRMVIRHAPWKAVPPKADLPTTANVGDLLLSKYLFPFELISLVLLVALIGAIVIARKDVRRKEGEAT